ncbi:hypothetical protein H072_11179 [Dactylellina haptotyla CBS 200.50]|uniref:Uncharacterized protein n=1 Tax=Dactylellina haptotyla (strain CBS 200.50) TaxID=1284197 RepID=S7ZXF9_DACHA|nr:hypothetical protein H072_11179 [Dactylellina haptotyla CBS 200.50]
MRPAVRLLQSAKAATTKTTPRLFPFHPTGIAGLPTHPNPRPTLLNVYNATLKKLSELPEESAYRTATEAIVKHRKRVVEEQIPAGFDVWCQDRQKRGLDSQPQYDDGVEAVDVSKDQILALTGNWEDSQSDDHEFVELEDWRKDEIKKARINEWVEKHKKKAPDYEGFLPEPDLSAEQVIAIEEQIGTGLVEEIIVQAYEEYKLVEVMTESKPWEPLMEAPIEGQWTYFEREKN